MPIRKFDLMWPGLDLTLLCPRLAWIQIAKWLRFLNYTCKGDYKSCAACQIFFYSGDLSWPVLDPDPYLEWHLCSQGIFTSHLRLLWLSFEQKLSILPDLGCIIQKRPNLIFDLVLTRDLRSILKIVSMLWGDFVKSFRTPPVVLLL